MSDVVELPQVFIAQELDPSGATSFVYNVPDGCVAFIDGIINYLINEGPGAAACFVTIEGPFAPINISINDQPSGFGQWILQVQPFGNLSLPVVSGGQIEASIAFDGSTIAQANVTVWGRLAAVPPGYDVG